MRSAIILAFILALTACATSRPTARHDEARWDEAAFADESATPTEARP